MSRSIAQIVSTDCYELKSAVMIENVHYIHYMGLWTTCDEDSKRLGDKGNSGS